MVPDTTLARRAAVGVGDRVRIAAHGGARAYRVSGIARPARTVPQATMFFAAAEADRPAAPTGSVADIATRTRVGPASG
ncbi:hypothetical protein [Embleya hyalina]|uniref:Uncharacterized protein n=1 Tax=Embleya hyalina TaxID=516124 RepID=A0A401YRJ4_9ACTN|nr:hypothetical protein [Embleya hyalina]GCD97223.1 hypothetical protein EHYA_04915 [Embleya hyalina]